MAKDPGKFDGTLISKSTQHKSTSTYFTLLSQLLQNNMWDLEYKHQIIPEPAAAVPALELVDVLHALLVVALHLGGAEVAVLAVRAAHRGRPRVVPAVALLLHVIQQFLGEGGLMGREGWLVAGGADQGPKMGSVTDFREQPPEQEGRKEKV